MNQQIAIDFMQPIFHIENNAESRKHFEDNEPKFNKQCRIVYDAFLRGEKLTTKIAVVKYNIMDLRRRVKDLIDTYGVNVQSKRVEGGHKEYWINLAA